MSVTINPPKTPVTAGSNGIAAATLPNVCKMPGPPAPFVPTPLPNIGKSGNSPQGYSKDVTIEGHPVAIQGATFKSMGDVASQGTGGGLISSNVEGPTSFVGPGSLDVKIEGKNVQLLSDPMLNNGGPSGTPANSGTMIGIIQASGLVIAVDETCPICESEKHPVKLEETTQSKVDAGSLAAHFEGQVIRASARVSTMLGVVRCQCGKKYADQSGVTTVELCSAAASSGMKHAAEVVHTIANRHLKLGEDLEVKNRIADRLAKSFSLNETWEECEERARLSRKERGMPAAYPPGVCAAQKALLLLGEDGALPGAMTERWYSRSGSGTQSPIAFRQEQEGGDMIPRSEKFAHGATVPPCRTCELIVPLLLCPGEKKECAHKS